MLQFTRPYSVGRGWKRVWFFGKLAVYHVNFEGEPVRVLGSHEDLEAVETLVSRMNCAYELGYHSGDLHCRLNHGLPSRLEEVRQASCR